MIYIGIGVIWTAWLEYYTVKHLSEKMDVSWSYLERIIQILTWPFGFGVFIYGLFKK